MKKDVAIGVMCRQVVERAVRLELIETTQKRKAYKAFRKALRIFVIKLDVWIKADDKEFIELFSQDYECIRKGEYHTFLEKYEMTEREKKFIEGILTEINRGRSPFAIGL